MMAKRTPDTESVLERLAGLFESGAGRTHRGSARRRARAVFETLGRDSDAQRAALLGFASDMIASRAVELTSRPPKLERVIQEIGVLTGIPRVALACEVLRAPPILELPAAAALQVDLALLRVFTQAQSVSLWRPGPDGESRRIAHAGDLAVDDPATLSLVRRLLRDEPDDFGRSQPIAGILVECSGRSAAALICRGGSSAQRALLLEAAAPLLGLVLERDELFAGETGRSHAELEASERRLARLRLDLHDGPQQDVLLLGEDLRHFRLQLDAVLDDRMTKDRLLGRIDDLEARMLALEADLRRISGLLQSPFLPRESLAETLRELTGEFAARSGIEPELDLRGDAGNLTDSQQITLLALIREALSNVRDHSGASRVTISLLVDSSGAQATVTDDGCGFEPETALVAAREGHLGLVGMHERARLLGGRTDIRSRPGGPTVISVRLPPVSNTSSR